MSSLEINFNKIKKTLKSSKKKRLLCVSTTANKNNPEIIFGPPRETQNTIAGNIILRNSLYINKIINFFDGFVDYFFIDSEIKNELKNLEKLSLSKIKKSKFLIYKPNDFTVESLDMFIACKKGSVINKNVLIIGGGNIGSKIALKLCERGALVKIYSKNYQKTKKITEGLNSFKKGFQKITATNKKEAVKNIDILLGCTPGIPVINEGIINNVKKDVLIIDVGGHTIEKKAIKLINKENLTLYNLSSMGGYIGLIENWLDNIKRIKNLKTKKIEKNLSLVSLGITGKKGDIIVDNVDNIKKIFGICDGLGDVFPTKEAKKYINSINNEVNNKKLLKKIKETLL